LYASSFFACPILWLKTLWQLDVEAMVKHPLFRDGVVRCDALLVFRFDFGHDLGKLGHNAGRDEFFSREELARGPRPQKDLEEKAAAKGLVWITVKRAKKA
jgi:hypothetical protein